MKLPSLTALRAFESAARNSSFTRAAEELHISQGAISQQIKLLETHLEVALFTRRKRKIELTAEGHRLASTLHLSFSDIASTVSSIQQKEHRILVISVPPTFAGNWLIPRLASFQEAYPEIEIRLDATGGLVDLNAGEADLAIRFGHGLYPGLTSMFLMRDDVFPVCSPRLLTSNQRPYALTEIAQHTLLHYEFQSQIKVHYDWQQFCDQFNIAGINTDEGPVFHQQHVLLQAALYGQGIALAQSHLVEEYLNAGQLIRPFTACVPHPCAYYIVHTKEQARQSNVQIFKLWLETQKTLAIEP